jgi:endoglucanase
MLTYIFVVLSAAAPMTPSELQKLMGVGINLGNTLEAPIEGQWAPRAQESFFDEFKRIGFQNVRVPVRWDNHTQTSPPYAVDPVFLDRVETILDWSLSRGFVTVVNTHHDDWLDQADDSVFNARLPRLKAIWTQMSSRFQNKSEKLLFEVYNEPHVMSVQSFNKMNAAILPIIRATNPTRVVVLGGLQWMGPSWVTSNPDALIIPDPSDHQLMLEIHNYDPFQYALQNPPTVHNWGSDSDIKALNDWMDSIVSWSKKKGLPIYYGEFGCTHSQTKATGRVAWYSEHLKAIQSHGLAASVWDDDGNFRVFDRNADTWDNEVLVALGKTPIGPNTPTPAPGPVAPTPPPTPAPAEKTCPDCTGGKCDCSWVKPTTCQGPGDGSCCFKCCCGK